MPKIAACLIVKNSEATLEACLNVIRPHVDGVFVYDTGSTDGTFEIIDRLNEQTEIQAVTDDADRTPVVAQLAPITVERGEWRDDFSWARTQSFLMPDESYDWILWLDDDDEIVGAQNLRMIAANARDDCHGFIFHYDYARDEHGNCVCQLWRERLLRRSAGYRWVQPIHEVLLPPEGVQASLVQINPAQARYVHHRPPDRYPPERNLRILLAQKERDDADGKPVEARTLAYLGTEYMARGDFGEAVGYLQQYLDNPETRWPDERAQVHHKLANCLRMLGNPTAAIEVEMRSLRERDDWPETLVGLAAAFASVGEWARAEWWARLAIARGEAYERAHGVALPPSPLILNPLEHTLLPLSIVADACMALDRFDDARDAIQKATLVCPIPEVRAKASEIEQASQLAELVGATLLLREWLVRLDENLKAWQLLQCVPYPIVDHPGIVEARIAQREMVGHYLRPEEYLRWYRDEPKESTVPDEFVEVIDEHIERAAFLVEGLDAQEEQLGRKPRVLDLGCNDFWISCFLWKKALVIADGVELNRGSFEKGLARKERFAAPGDIYHGDLHDAAALTGRKYDAVVLFEVLEHVPDVDETLALLESLLEPGGRVYLTTPNGAFDRGLMDDWNRVERKGHLRAIPANELAETLIGRGDVHDFRTHQNDRLTFASYEPKEKKGTVSFFAGASWEPWSPASLRLGGIGGSETALVQVATRVAQQGYTVKVYSGAEPGLFAGVLYRPFHAWDPAEPVDLLVSSRRADIADLPSIGAKHLALWCHDHSYPGMLTEERAARFDSIVVLSEWQRKRFARLYPFLADKLRIIRNGITVFEQDGSPRYAHANRGFKRREPRAVYSSSADRGLDVLLEMWPRIRDQVPDAELHIFYGWETFDRVAQTNPDLWAFKTKVLGLARDAGGEAGGVFFRGRVGQVELAEEMQQARVLAYPTAFLETSCITAMEARAAGLPIVTSRLGGLRESAVGQLLVAWPAEEDEPFNRDDAYQATFVPAVVRMLSDRDRWDEAHGAALADVNEMDWSQRIPEWLDLLEPAKKREKVAA